MFILKQTVINSWRNKRIPEFINSGTESMPEKNRHRDTSYISYKTRLDNDYLPVPSDILPWALSSDSQSFPEVYQLADFLNLKQII